MLPRDATGTPADDTVGSILERALAWLREHPDSSAKTIANAIGVRDDRWVYRALHNAAFEGKCQCWKAENGPWLWEVPGASGS